MASEAPLAVRGGPRAVTTGYRERWRAVRRRDAIRVARYALRDVNTLSKGEGPIKEFEARFAALTGSAHALAMNSGTATLHSAYFAAGARPGDEVIVPAYTFFASAAPVLQCGATPVFCDVDPETLTADPDDVERRITPRTKAICVVHMWGNPAPMDRLADIARRHGVTLVEDCSHAHGATYLGRPVGSWGDIGCFSLQGAKAVSGGEAGIAVTDDPVLFDRMLLLGHYGRLKKGQAAKTFRSDHLSLGVKYRPHLYAILLAQGSLERLGELNRRRRRNYEILAEELDRCAAVRPVPTTPGAVRGGFLEYILHYDPEQAGGVGRDAFIAAAAAEGVPVAPERYAALGAGRRMLHETAIFTSPKIAAVGGALPAPHPAGALPHTAALQGRLLTLPPFTRVPERFVREVARALRKVADRPANVPEPSPPSPGRSGVERRAAPAAGWLEPLTAALDAAEAPVSVFLRDDDAGWDDDRLFALLDVVGALELPLDLAVIPRELRPGLAEALLGRAARSDGRLGLHQHGLAHVNREASGRRCEFGAARGPDQQRADLAEGAELLRAALGPSAQPIFTPPWNRCTRATAELLAELGFAVLSRDADADPFGVPGLVEIPVALDWSYAKRRGRRLELTELGALAAAIVRDGGPLGINLHHAVMDRQELGAFGELGRVLAAHPGARAVPMMELAASRIPG